MDMQVYVRIYGYAMISEDIRAYTDISGCMKMQEYLRIYGKAGISEDI
jgi:hypothetical protein